MEETTKSADVKLLPKVLWLMLALFALVNGLGALRYLLPHVPFPVELDNFSQRRIALSLHALGGAIADGRSRAFTFSSRAQQGTCFCLFLVT